MAKEVKQELVQQAQDLHQELQVILDAIKTDLVKCSSGNGAAGVRVRKDLRLFRQKVSEVIKFTTAVGDAYKAPVSE
jgi:hypothetical protein